MTSMQKTNHFESCSIAVLIPCHNEELTIKNVISKFKKNLPMATVYVYDNASSDNTKKYAIESGAVVFSESKKGKGNVVRRMFADIEADVYIMIDGDDTYDIFESENLIKCLLKNNHDMVIGSRKSDNDSGAYRTGHIFGNWILSKSVSFLFGGDFKDMLSGYRVMSRRFVKSFPILSKGFEIETEMTVHALQLGASCEEIHTQYFSRPKGSNSKLNTISDGLRILKMIFLLFKEEKPFYFFSIVSLFFFIFSISIATPIFITYSQTGMVPRLPTAVLSTGLMILSFLSLISGIILDSLSRTRLELKKLNYLTYPYKR